MIGILNSIYRSFVGVLASWYVFLVSTYQTFILLYDYQIILKYTLLYLDFGKNIK